MSGDAAAAPAWAPVQALLDAGVARRLFSGVSVAVWSPTGPVFTAVAGTTAFVGRPVPVQPDTPFDCASLTKVLATAPLALRLHAQGRLLLDAPLRRVLPQAPAGVSARHCLLHVSGLPAWDRLWVALAGRVWGTAATRAAALAHVCATPLAAPPGTRHRYSDLGMMLLAGAIEAAGGDRFDRLWAREVAPHCGADLRWGWPGAAATERCPVRGRLLAGEVHDLNCAVLGGISGHAGLFGSAGAVAQAGAWWLRAHGGRADEGLDPAAVRAAFAADGPGSHKLGWDGISPGASAAGPRWPLDGVGHLGFTGCSLYLSPQDGVSVAILSNRVHPVVEGGAVPGAPLHPRYAAFKQLRRDLHGAVLDAVRGQPTGGESADDGGVVTQAGGGFCPPEGAAR